MAETERDQRPGRLWRAYTETAVVVMNTIVFFVLLNAALYGVFLVKDHRMQREIERAAAAADPAAKYGKEFLSTVYPGWGSGALDTLMAESWGRPYAFEPFTQFRERPVRGRYVNVDPAGFRLVKDQGPWPARAEDFNIFFFGGSTAFGYGLPDDQTIPSYLQEALAGNSCGRRVSVYNFGRGFYFSTQERIAFEQLLTAGHRPGLAVFLDGLNDFYHRADAPSFSDRLAAVVEGREDAAAEEVPRLPVLRAAWSLQRRLSPPAAAEGSAPGTPAEDSAAAEAVVRRWLANRAILEAVGERFSTPLLFVWQPVPTYGYDLENHPFSGGDLDAFKEHRLSHYGYPLMRDRVDAGKEGSLLWLAEMQRGRREGLYLDMVHYTADFSREIAQLIAERIVEDGLVCGVGRS